MMGCSVEIGKRYFERLSLCVERYFNGEFDVVDERFYACYICCTPVREGAIVIDVGEKGVHAQRFHKDCLDSIDFGELAKNLEP